MDQKIGEVNLIAADSVEASQLLVFWERVKSFLTSPWFWGGLIVLAGAAHRLYHPQCGA